MSKAPLIERAREAFAAYRGLGLEIIDEMILALTIANAALTVANAEVARLRADRDRLRDAAASVVIVERDTKPLAELRAAIAAVEKQGKEL